MPARTGSRALRRLHWAKRSSRLRVSTKLPEIADVAQWLEDSPVVQEVGEIHLSRQPVLKADTDPMIVASPGVDKRWRAAHGLMIVPYLKGSIGMSGCFCPALPVVAKLGSASPRPGHCPTLDPMPHETRRNFAKRWTYLSTFYMAVVDGSGRGATRQSAPRPVAPSGGCRYLCVVAAL